MTTFITGASRGIGLALTRRVLATTTFKVVGASRTALSSPGLLELQKEYGNRLRIAEMDLTDEKSIFEAAKNVEGTCPILVHAGAIMHRSGRGENSVRRLDMSEMTEVMQANVLGPAILTRALWPSLQKAARETESPSKVVAVGAGVGSISTNEAGGWYSYRISKTALNALMKNLSIEGARANILTMTLYPEMVNTEFAKSYLKSNPYPQLREPDEVAQEMMKRIQVMTKADTGRFVNLWSGNDIPF